MQTDRKEKDCFSSDVSTTPQYRRLKEDRRTVFSNLPDHAGKRNLNGRRKDKPNPGITYNFWIQSFKSVYTCLRDALVWFLPKWIIRRLVGSGDFAFIAHPRNFEDVPRMFPFTKYLPEKFVRFWFRFQWPFVAARIMRQYPKNSKKIKGWLLICPLWAEQMIKNTSLARKRVINTVKLAEKLGCKIAGLGAFTSIVTHDGRDLIGKTSIGITTGNSFSAAIAVANLTHALALSGKSLASVKIAIVGAAGSVGSGCSRALVENAKEIHLIDINKRALLQLYSDLKNSVQEKKSGVEVIIVEGLSRLSECDGIIVVTNTIKAIVNEKHLKKGAIVIDCAQPKNVSFNIPKSRLDVLVIESAIVHVPGLYCNFDLDVNQEEALGCMAESMILSTMNEKKSILGSVKVEEMRNVYKTAVDLGIRLAYFRNSSGFVTENDILSVRNGE